MRLHGGNGAVLGRTVEYGARDRRFVLAVPEIEAPAAISQVAAGG
jgi:hypothetical protein